MIYTRMGRSGLMVSRICLGMMSFGDTSSRQWHLNFDEAEPIARRAVEAGVTFFDTADMYDLGASEQVTGRLLTRFFAKRDNYVLATKVYFPMGRERTTGGCLVNTFSLRSMHRSPASALITSICTGSIGGTMRLLSRRQ